MKNLIKLKVLLPIFITFFITKSVAAERILPVPKPTIDLEVKKKIDKKKEIYPQKKPKNKIASNEDASNLEKIDEEASPINETEVFIYPEKKPIIVQKKIIKVVEKSTILSKRDFEIAKSAFESIDQKKWQTALKTTKKARDVSLYNLINYLYLKKILFCL